MNSYTNLYKNKIFLDNINIKYLNNIVLAYISLIYIFSLNGQVLSFFSDVSLYISCFILIIGYIALNKIDIKLLTFILFLALFLIIGLTFTGGGIGSVVTFIFSILFFFLLRECKFSKTQINYILFLNICAILYLFVYSFFGRNNYNFYFLNGYNPNSLGMILVYSFMMWSSFSVFSKRSTKFLFVILAISSLIGIYHYKARSSLIALVCYLILLVVPQKIVTKKSTMFVILCIIIFGTLFPMVYVKLYEAGVSITLFGKSLFTGRQEIWGNVLDLLEKNPFSILLGLGSDEHLWGYDSMNVHNNYLNIIVCFGLFIYLLYFGILVYYLNKTCERIKNHQIRRFVASFVSMVFIAGAFEIVTFFSTFYVFAYSGLAFANRIDE